MSPKPKQPPSANWLALQKVGELLTPRRRGHVYKILQEINPNRRKKRKLGHETAPEQHPRRGEPSSSSVVSGSTQVASIPAPPAHCLPTGIKNGESIDLLRRMILGELENQYTGHQKQYVFGALEFPKLGLANFYFILFYFTKARKIYRPRL